MKRLLILLIALVAIFALVLPTSAVELKFGGLFAQKFYATENQHDGRQTRHGSWDDNSQWFYTRMRLYFTGVASENLKAVSKFEIDDFWGQGRLGSLSADGGSNNDAAGMEIKNAYIDFIVPDTALNIKMGIIGARLDKPAWVFNDDTSGFFGAYKYGEWYFAGLYSRLGDSNTVSPSSSITPTTSSDDVDIWAFAVNYNMEGLFTAFNFAWISNDDNWANNDGLARPGSTADPGHSLDLYVFSLDADYSSDVFSVYGDVALNAGKSKQTSPDSDFKGYAFMAGGTYAATDTITVGADFYYASGDKLGNDDFKSFQTAGAPSGRNAYNMDEVVFPGWFDDDTVTIQAPGGPPNTTNVTSTGLGTNAGYCLNNIWAIGAHADFKPWDKTLIQFGGAYMGFVEKVASRTSDGQAPDATLSNVLEKDNKLGGTLYLRASQGIVDGLTLKAAVGYFSADEGFTPHRKDDDAYRIAAGLFWSW
jgi:hypothetical protein